MHSVWFGCCDGYKLSFSNRFLYFQVYKHVAQTNNLSLIDVYISLKRYIIPPIMISGVYSLVMCTFLST